jgi:hypothetical protein
MTRLPHYPQPELSDEQRQFARTVTEVRREASREVDRAIIDIGTRRWCLEMAVKAGATGDATVPLARDMLEFLRGAVPEN